MLFESKQHKEMFEKCINRIRDKNDVYRVSALYALTCCNTIRKHIEEVYDFECDSIDFDCFDKGWLTGTTLDITRFAFNMFNDFHGFNDSDTSSYTPYQLFGNCYCRYLLEAVKLRYPEYNTEDLK